MKTCGSVRRHAAALLDGDEHAGLAGDDVAHGDVNGDLAGACARRDHSVDLGDSGDGVWCVAGPLRLDDLAALQEGLVHVDEDLNSDEIVLREKGRVGNGAVGHRDVRRAKSGGIEADD